MAGAMIPVQQQRKVPWTASLVAGLTRRSKNWKRKVYSIAKTGALSKGGTGRQNREAKSIRASYVDFGVSGAPGFPRSEIARTRVAQGTLDRHSSNH
eukprot:gene15995-22129_t